MSNKHSNCLLKHSCTSVFQLTLLSFKETFSCDINILSLLNLFLISSLYILRRGYVPGYTGCVLWTNPKPPLSAEREPRRESTARVHRFAFCFFIRRNDTMESLF